jgi:hypothetical protein
LTSAMLSTGNVKISTVHRIATGTSVFRLETENYSNRWLQPIRMTNYYHE